MSATAALLATLLTDPERIASVRPESIPPLLGEVEALKARLWAQLQASAVPAQPAPSPPKNGTKDRLLTANEAADALGVSRRWMYRKADSLPFTRRLSGGTLRFSSRGLTRWQESRR